MLCEQLEERRLLFGHTTGLGGLFCEVKGEEGRALIQAAAQLTDARSPNAVPLPGAYKTAVSKALKGSFPNIDTVLDNIRVSWDATLTDVDIYGAWDLALVDAQTYGNNIYVRGERPDVAFNSATSELLLHEIVHTLQFERYGPAFRTSAITISRRTARLVLATSVTTWKKKPIASPRRKRTLFGSTLGLPTK